MPQSQPIEHPGEILVKEFLSPRSVSQYRVAVDTGVPPRRINEIVHGKRGITADTALRLARYFGNDPLYWLQLQARWDLQRARERLGSRLDEVVTQPEPKPIRDPQPQPQPQSKPKPKPKPEPEPRLADHLL
jgi:antitoxin HigA-1